MRDLKPFYERVQSNTPYGPYEESDIPDWTGEGPRWADLCVYEHLMQRFVHQQHTGTVSL